MSSRARYLFVLAWLVSWAEAPAQGANLTRIDRRLAKEPAYQSERPKYCLLAFGREARFRVWLVLDQGALYVDRNGNGDLTEKGEAVGRSGYWMQVGDLIEPDGKTRHTRLRLRLARDGVQMMVMVEGK